MFKPLSLQGEYTLCSSLDPALDLPDAPEIDLETATPEEIAAHDKISKEREGKLRVAQNTGNWPEITKHGQSPTMFRFRQIHGPLLTWLQGEITRNNLTDDEGFELAFRLALEGVDNFGKVKTDFVARGRHRLAGEKIMARLYDVGRDPEMNQPLLGRFIVLELGALVLTRAVQGVRPLS